MAEDTTAMRGLAPPAVPHLPLSRPPPGARPRATVHAAGAATAGDGHVAACASKAPRDATPPMPTLLLLLLATLLPPLPQTSVRCVDTAPPRRLHARRRPADNDMLRVVMSRARIDSAKR
eukprot:356961-Chlamydomonas_euryale.AAC.1